MDYFELIPFGSALGYVSDVVSNSLFSSLNFEDKQVYRLVQVFAFWLVDWMLIINVNGFYVAFGFIASNIKKAYI